MDKRKVESVQRRATKLIPELKDKTYELSEGSITSVQRKEGRYDRDVQDNGRIGSIGDHKTFRPIKERSISRSRTESFQESFCESDKM